MGKKLKVGAIVCAGTVVAAIFARGVKAIIDDIKADDDFFDDFDDDGEDFYEDESLFEDEDDLKSSTDSSHTNFTHADDDVPVDKNADEASAKTVSSDNIKE